MSIHPGGNLFLYGEHRIPAAGVICLFFTISFLALPGRGWTEPNDPIPKVIMLGLSDSTHNDADLYRAVRAQMSAVPLFLDRIEIDPEQQDADDPLGSASKTATEHHAAMVFWIEDNETCTMFFYIPNTDGGRINSRVLNLDLTGRTSRFEIIAIAAASMIEGLLVSHPPKPVPRANKPIAATHSPPVPISRKRKWVEIFAAYAGSYFAADMVTNGIQLGLGVLPIHRLVISASYLQNMPMTQESEEYRLTIRSKMVEISAAGRALIDPVDIRLGITWSIDLRSYSTTSMNTQIDAKPGGFNGLNALIPFVSVSWFFTERMGLFGSIGASIAINEQVYKIKYLDGSETVSASPFFVKLSYQFGLLVQL